MIKRVMFYKKIVFLPVLVFFGLTGYANETNLNGQNPIHYKFVNKVTISKENYGLNPGSDSENDVLKIETQKRTWGNILGLDKDIPIDKFDAYFFDTTNPTQIIRQQVDNINVNFSYADNYGIASNNFGAYWVGWKRFREEKSMKIVFDLGWAETRILINDREIFIGSGHKELDYIFKEGKNKIEVEYINNWHTTDFIFGIKENEKKYRIENIKNELNNITKNYDVWYAGAYESAKNDFIIDVNLESAKKDTVVVLSAYSQVRWRIKNINKYIKAIIYNGMSLDTLGNKDVKIFPIERILYTYTIKPNYNLDNSGKANFDDMGIKGISDYLEKNIGKKVSGFTVNYSMDSIRLPENYLTKELEKEIAKLLEDLKKTEKKKAKTIETLFEEE